MKACDAIATPSDMDDFQALNANIGLLITGMEMI